MLSAHALADLSRAVEPREVITSTGFAEIDELTGGMSHGRVWLVVGRPGEGLTTLTVQWAAALASQPGEHIHLVTGRESPQAVAARLWSLSGLIPLNWFPARLGDVADERRELAGERVSALSLSLYARGDDYYVPEVHPTRAAARPTALVMDDADLVSGVTLEWVRRCADEGMFVLLSLPRSRVLPHGDDWDLDPGWARAADVILEIQHRQLFDESRFRPGEADLHIRYNRQGYIRTVAIQHQAHFARFVEGPS